MISLNPFRLNRCDWFMVAWVVYYLQGILYAEAGVLSIALLGVNLMVSVFCAVKVCLMRDTPVYFRGLGLLLVLFSIYGFTLILSNPSDIYYPISGFSMKSYNYIKSIYLSMLPIYAFYYFSRKGYLTEERLKIWALIFFASCIISYYHYQSRALVKLMARGLSAEEVTNNAGYLFLSLIPVMVLYRKSPLLQYAGLATIMAFVVLGMKRGAIMIGTVVTIYFLWNTIKHSKGKRKFAFILLTLLLCIGAFYFVVHQMATSEYMAKRIEDTIEGNSSGRDSLYDFFWIYFTEKADFMHYLIGRGANGTLEIYKNYAHNDWLEIAINQGLVGVVIYIIYWRNFYKTWKLASNYEAKQIIAMVAIIYFAKTLFSMSYADMTYVCTSVLGYALANMNKQNHTL